MSAAAQASPQALHAPLQRPRRLARPAAAAHMQQAARRRRCAAAGAGRWAPAPAAGGAAACWRVGSNDFQAAAAEPEPLQVWDVVLLDGPDGSPLLGRIADIRGSELSIERLEEGREELQSVWVVAHDEEQRVPRGAVRRTVAADYMQVVDPDRVSNPHGEHALEAYRLLEPIGDALAALGGGGGSGGAGEQQAPPQQ